MGVSCLGVTYACAISSFLMSYAAVFEDSNHGKEHPAKTRYVESSGLIESTEYISKR